MTQPDELSPDGDLQGAFATFQGKTQEDYEAERSGAEQDRWGGGILDVLFEGLPAGMSFTLALLTMLARSLLGIPTLIWDSVDDLLEDVPFLGESADLIQNFFDALVNGLTGSNTTGNSPLAALLAILGQGAQVPLQLVQTLDQMWASIAQLTAGQQALQNSPGTVLLDDFATVGVSGYTNIIGTLAISSVGPYIQTPNFALAYRTTSPAADQQGGQIVIDANQQGWSGVGICSDTAATSYALLQVYSGFQGDAVRLLTGSSPTVAVVQQQTDFITTRLADTNTFDIWYESVTDTFHVLRNGQKVFDWPDTSNIVTHDGSHRKGLLFSNGEDNPENGRRGPGLRKAQFYVKT